MKQIFLLTSLLIAYPAFAGISPEIKATCMNAKDFVGCVKALSGESSIQRDDGLGSLRKAMKQVAARLSSGTSLRDSSLTFQPVIDEFSIVEEIYPDSLAVKAAKKSIALFDIIQSSWQSRISSLSTSDLFGTTYSCKPTQAGINAMNMLIGSHVIKAYSVTKKKEVDLNKGLFCYEETSVRNEQNMIKFVIGVLREGSVAPSTIEEYEANRSEKIRLAQMSAWEKHLDKNPGVKAWAEANPTMAANEQVKFNSKNPSKEVAIPAYADTLRYLSKFNPPL